MATRHPDVLILGGGLIGLSCARALAREGLRVKVIERSEPGREASRAAAGMLAPLAEVPEPGPFFEACRASRDLWGPFVRDLEEESGRPVDYDDEGALVPALSGQEELLERLERAAGELGEPAERLGPEELVERLPGIRGELGGGLRLPGEHRVHNGEAVRAAAAAARASGVEIVTGREALKVETLPGGVRVRGALGRVLGAIPELGPDLERQAGDPALAGTAVEGSAVESGLSTSAVAARERGTAAPAPPPGETWTPEHRVGAGDGGGERGRGEAGGERPAGNDMPGTWTEEAGTVVVALGAWSSRLAGVPPLPVRPVRGQMLALDGVGWRFAGTVRGTTLYAVRRRPSELVVGATEEEAGFSTHTTAAGIGRLLDFVRDLFPGLAQRPLTRFWAGLRPGTPDGLPILGALGSERVLAATGHYRNGILLAPWTAERIAEAVTSGSVPADLAPFTPDRFT